MACTLSAAMSEIAKILSWLGFTSRLKFQDKVPNYTWPDLQVVEENILVEVYTVIKVQWLGWSNKNLLWVKQWVQYKT